MNALKGGDIARARELNDIKIIKECKNEQNQWRINDRENGVSYFFITLKVISKIIQTYRELGIIKDNDCVVY